MRRLFIGFCAVALLIAGFSIWMQGETASHHVQMAAAGFVRVGLLCSAVWLAWPQVSDLVERVPRWVGLTLLGCLGVIVFRPRLIIFVAPLLFALLLLHWLGLLIKPKR